MALFAYIFNGLPNCVSALKWSVCVTKDGYWVKLKKSSGKPVQRHTKQSLLALFSANSPQMGFSPFKHLYSYPLKNHCWLPSLHRMDSNGGNWEGTVIITENSTGNRKKYQRIPVQASLPLEHRTKYYRKQKNVFLISLWSLFANLFVLHSISCLFSGTLESQDCLIIEVTGNESDNGIEAKILLQYICIWLAVLVLSFNKK